MQHHQLEAVRVTFTVFDSFTFTQTAKTGNIFGIQELHDKSLKYQHLNIYTILCLINKDSVIYNTYNHSFHFFTRMLQKHRCHAPFHPIVQFALATDLIQCKGPSSSFFILSCSLLTHCYYFIHCTSLPPWLCLYVLYKYILFID